jgi:hypothetical protein
VEYLIVVVSFVDKTIEANFDTLNDANRDGQYDAYLQLIENMKGKVEWLMRFETN